MGMATLPLTLSLFRSNTSLYAYTQKNNLRDSSKSIFKKYLPFIIYQYVFIFKYYKLLRSSEYKKNCLINIVAAYVSQVDLIVANEISNFEYDDNEWDIGIGNLIINLDADIEKTRDEKQNLESGMASTPSTSSHHQIQITENINLPCSDKNLNLSTNQALSSLPSSSTDSSRAPCNTNIQSSNLSNITNTSNNSLQLTINSCKTNSSCNNFIPVHSGKMAVEHSATVDKGLKMKIKRTKPGTKSSEAKHEIVKSNEVNGSLLNQDDPCGMSTTLPSTISTTLTSQCVQNIDETQCSSLTNKSKSNLPISSTSASTSTTFITSKRTSSNHRRDKGREKYEKLQNNNLSQLCKIESNDPTKQANQNNMSLVNISEPSNIITLTNSNMSSLKLNSSLENEQNTSISTANIGNNSNQSMELPLNTSQVQFQGCVSSSRNTAFKITQTNTCSSEISNNSPTYLSNISLKACSNNSAQESKNSTNIRNIHSSSADNSLNIETDSPPCKKSKNLAESDLKEMSDVCTGTSVGTITEPDCLGPCEPGTSVTLEGIVWHETEGGVLVVNITWRGKTYVGTLLDCTRHDWAPPRFCDSPISDLDVRATKGRTKRGRTATNIISNNDLINFTETRSSVHSKLRNSGNKGRRGAHGSPATCLSSTAFVPPRTDITAKRKPRCFEEDDKNKRKIPPPTPPNASPPTSPVLLECPELNCCKKYKHIDGLKYHQSHAHGSIDDEDVKEIITSMSENDESNIESPSPITSIKSPLDKIESMSNSLHSPSTNILEHGSNESSLTLHVTTPDIETSSMILNNIVKPSILKYKSEDCSLTIDSTSPSRKKSEIHTDTKSMEIISENTILRSHSPLAKNSPPPSINNSIEQYNTKNLIIPSQLQHNLDDPVFKSDSHLIQSTISQQLSTTSNSSQLDNNLLTCDQLQVPGHSTSQPSNLQLENKNLSSFLNVVNQSSTLHNISDEISSEVSSINHSISPSIGSIHNIQTHLQSFSHVCLQSKIPQFKVKPTAALMPEHDKNKDSKQSKVTNLKKKSRKSPLNSSHVSPLDTIIIDAGRDDVQSPAYSDISDDAIPIDESETNNKILKQNQDKNENSSPQNHLATHFSMYPYYAQSPYLIQNIQEKSTHEYKINDVSNKADFKSLNMSIPNLTNLENLNADKNKKESISSEEVSESQSQYYSNYNTYISSNYPFQSQSNNTQNMSHLPELEFLDEKQKIKQESQSQILKEKHLENHQILKESIEIKNQMSPYQLYHNSESQRPSPTTGIGSDDRRYYIYPGEQRRKEDMHKQNISQKPLLSPKHQSKQDKILEINKNDDVKIKQEGVKPTMETQGPPPPPTSQYAYIHPGYIPSHHYGSISYDTGHPGIYRNLTPMLVPGTYASNPYLHQLPRYHAPEDLSRSPGAKALDLLQHHANQYYTNHKIHELQERALKSPIPKTTTGSSPLSTGQPISIRSPNNAVTNVIGSSLSSQSQSLNNKQQNQNLNQQQHQQCISGDGNSSSKDNRSPPPQRHVHTHHHTHVGLGYPILPGQYPTPYGVSDKSSKQWENGYGMDF